MRISYPDSLPVSQRRDDIAAAIRDHQVVIVAGETGSGKTTQLPKICLELGRGTDGRTIGHTQPRRIAARTVAERIAEELGTELGDIVGYQVRFTDRSSARTQVKVMTDGILLAEIQRDRELRRYDTIIIDEAHERSLNIDFLLGYFKQLLPRRPDLKVIITSATIDPERFSAHFDGAPIIEVSGRTYAVEVRYREQPDDQTTGIVDAVRELMTEGPGDILVFLSGEREIRDAADALQRVQPRRPIDAFDVLPLFARLSAAEQHRVFASHTRRRVVLATNVAETSLTVPGIRYVVDTGLARISRYSARTKVQRLPIEPISQASADQRKGRCGRVAEGICIRLYSEEDFDGRPEFTDPEILRTNLAAVILQMASLDLGDVARFPFVEPPDTRSVQAGVQLLEEIGAITTRPSRSSRSGRRRSSGRRPQRDGAGPSRPRLTRIGRQLAQLPIDPRLGRMMLEASRNACLAEVIVIVSALSMQDPRERPAEQQEQADSKHRRFADPTSDFAGMLNLWRYLKEQQSDLSSSAFRRMCRADHLNYLRIREWQDLDSQLRRASKQLGWKTSKQPAAAEAIHRSLLAGLLSHIGMKDVERRDYLGARGTRFAVFPGSALFKKPPTFVMAAELVETGRLWARVNAGIEPEWAEQLAGDLVKRTHSEPHWEKKRGSVVALERVTLYGVPLVTERKVNFGRIDPEAAREIFVRHALVQGEWTTHHRFFAHNQQLLEEAEELEHRARRRDIVVDEETLFDFYDARVPSDVVSTAHFDSWWKKQRHDTPDLLDFDVTMLTRDTDSDDLDAEYPQAWRHGDVELPLHYAFEPGAEADGVTVDIPVEALNQVDPADFTWPVPGLRQELVVALIRSLPKPKRVKLVPAPNHASAFLAATTPGELPLLDALETYVRRTAGEHIDRSDWDLDKVPGHLRIGYRITGTDGDVLAEGKDLESLKGRLTGTTRRAVASAAATLVRSGLTTWDFDTLPRTFTQTRAGHDVRGYPALVDDGDTVSIDVFGTEGEQQTAMRGGTRRLLARGLPPLSADVVARLTNTERLSLSLAPEGTVQDLLDDCTLAAVDDVVDRADGPAWDRAGFERLQEAVATEVPTLLDSIVRQVIPVLQQAQSLDRRLTGRADLALLPALTDMRAQWGRLLAAGFVTRAGVGRLRHYPRYLTAMETRLDRLPGDLRRDATLMGSMAHLQEGYLHQLAGRDVQALPPDVAEVGWMLEELRVSLWAQQLRTPQPVSVSRLERALRDL